MPELNRLGHILVTGTVFGDSGGFHPALSAGQQTRATTAVEAQSEPDPIRAPAPTTDQGPASNDR